MKKEKNKGITLIALVITIIVLLILAGVTIASITGENGILEKATEAREKTKKSEQEEMSDLDNVLNLINNSAPSTDGYNESKKVNSPKISQGMIPIKWNGENWMVCDNKDTEWYSYENKNWANIMLNDGKYKSDTVKVGQIVKDDELGSMYVWIPRYAYTVDKDNQKMNVTFIKGNTNEGTNGEVYTTDEGVDTTSTKLVHPGFNFGGTALTGIWVAKFEASGTDKNGNAVGNAKEGITDYNNVVQQYEPDETTIAKSLPNKISWRHITIGECEKRSMNIATIDKDKFGIKNVNSHLIKNSEWGAVAYLCYSQYGNIPKINGAGKLSLNPWYACDMYTGQGPKEELSDDNYNKENDNYNYNTINGQLASTNGNITGIYDMNGGAWEVVAGFLDNNNGNLNNNGKSNDGMIKYFENGTLNAKYLNMWNSYEVSNEEKENKIKIDDNSTITQISLWNNSKTEEKYQIARKRLTEYIYLKMGNHNGIGINEVNLLGESFHAPFKNSEGKISWGWFKTTEEPTKESGANQQYGRAWDSDGTLIGHASLPFILRGGNCGSKKMAGILCSSATGGNAENSVGFRATLIL